MAEWLATNWRHIIGVVGILLTGVGAYLSLKGWKRKRPTYVLRSNNIFSGLEHTIPNVEVKFIGYGPPVKTLTVTKIALWNAGTETINRQDVVKENPLAIRAKDGVVILSVNIIERTTPYNKCECTLNKERTGAAIAFEYLDHNQGALIQVFHTGMGNDDMQVEGTIKGVPRIRRLPVNSPSSKRQRPKWALICALCMPWLLLGILLYGIFNPPLRPGGPDKGDPFLLIGWCLTFIATVMTTGLAGYCFYITNPPKPLSKIHREKS